DCLLVWPEDQTELLDEDRVKLQWAQGRRYQRLGPNLFLVGGLPGQRTQSSAAGQPLPSTEGCPRQHAEHLLTAPRHSGDRAKEAAALTDMGIIVLSEGDARGAITWLEQALALTRELGDTAKESDVIGNLGMAALTVQQPLRAREMFEHSLAHARSTGD